MRALNVAVVSRDRATRLEAARAFDSAPSHWIVELHHDRPADADVVVAGPDMDIEADAAFDPAHPGRILDDVAGAAHRAQGARVVAVTSPSGGTGVTSIALHLARAAAGGVRGGSRAWPASPRERRGVRGGRRAWPASPRERRGRRAWPAESSSVCLADCDVEWGAGYRLGLPVSARTWADARDSGESILQAALPVPGGFRVLVGPVEAGSSGSDALFEAARSQFDRVIADAGRASTRPGLLRDADAVILVLAPTAPSARRGRDVIDGMTGAQTAIVTNRTGPGGEMTRSEIERILGAKIALELPSDPKLRDAEDDGRLLASPWSRWDRGVHRLWRTLEGTWAIP